MRKLPDRVWKLPRREDDEAVEEGIGRILALSDGVFAVAITLLIFEIAVPAATSDASLPKALLGLWPRYLAWPTRSRPPAARRPPRPRPQPSMTRPTAPTAASRT